MKTLISQFSLSFLQFNFFRYLGFYLCFHPHLLHGKRAQKIEQIHRAICVFLTIFKGQDPNIWGGWCNCVQLCAKTASLFGKNNTSRKSRSPKPSFSFSPCIICLYKIIKSKWTTVLQLFAESCSFLNATQSHLISSVDTDSSGKCHSVTSTEPGHNNPTLRALSAVTSSQVCRLCSGW